MKGDGVMARKHYRYSLDRHDAKLAGVCSTIGKKIGVDPTLVRIAWIAVPLLTPLDFTTALVAYALVGLYLAIQRKREVDARGRASAFERMEQAPGGRPSIHRVRTELDETDRRLMAIDHHIHSQNDELAREIEALREEK
jgi:phage shock protein PspC (stress-responsive transcriptional regulator)